MKALGTAFSVIFIYRIVIIDNKLSSAQVEKEYQEFEK